MDDKVSEIRKLNNIVEVISGYIPLVKKGKNFFGVCPFHDDTNPSMSVSEDKQIYKCFSCGASGNVFNFVMDYEKVDFKTALNILGDRVGIKTNNVITNNKNDKYIQMYDIAAKLYQNNINTSLGNEAISYLEKRSINKELIKEFRIGLSLLDKNNLTNILLKKNYTKKEMEDLGLGNGSTDLFINRIMFPLFNLNGEVVAFSGRIYNTKSDSKYINTKETKIFKKGELLYNYHKARDFVRKEKVLVIVEGFMDVIRLYTIGIKNVVALMGTALTKEQTTLIKRASNNIIICLDGDSAGQKATFAVGEELEKNGLNVKVITLKENKDPDEFILKYGKDEFLSLYNNPKDYIEFKTNYLKKDEDLTTIEGKSIYINKVLADIAKQTDLIKQELMLDKLSKEFEINIEILKNKLQNLMKYSKIEALKKEETHVNKNIDKYTKATYRILYSMLNSYDAVKTYIKKLNYLPLKEARYLANDIIYYYKMHGTLILADFISTLYDKPDLKKLLDYILNIEIEDSNNYDIDEYIKVIDGYNKNQEIKRLKEKMKDEPDVLKKASIAEEIRKLKIGVES